MKWFSELVQSASLRIRHSSSSFGIKNECHGQQTPKCKPRGNKAVSRGKLWRPGSHWNLVARRHSSFAGGRNMSLSVASPCGWLWTSHESVCPRWCCPSQGANQPIVHVTQSGHGGFCSLRKFLPHAPPFWCTLLKSIGISCVYSGL